MPRFFTCAVVGMLVLFTETENIGEQVCKGRCKESNVFASGHINIKKSTGDPRSHVGTWLDGSGVQKNGWVRDSHLRILIYQR